MFLFVLLEARIGRRSYVNNFKFSQIKLFLTSLNKLKKYQKNRLEKRR